MNEHERRQSAKSVRWFVASQSVKEPGSLVGDRLIARSILGDRGNWVVSWVEQRQQWFEGQDRGAPQ